MLTLGSGTQINVGVLTVDASDVSVSGADVTSVPGNNYYTNRTLTGTAGGTITLTGNIKKLGISGTIKNLTALDVGDLTNLETLYCAQQTSLKTLNVQGASALKRLTCNECQLKTLNAQGASALETLECYKNQLTEINIQGCNSLKEVKVFENKLNEDAFINIFNALTDKTGITPQPGIALYNLEESTEKNCTDFTGASASQGLKNAFNNAKDNKNWKMWYLDSSGNWGNY